MTSGPTRTITVRETARVPALDWVFAFGPMLVLVAGAAAGWMLSGAARAEAIGLTILWSAAILLFLSGVRRGLSFRTAGGPTAAQIGTMLGLFILGAGALLAWRPDHPAAALAALIAGYGAVMVLDPVAARRGEAPLSFAHLRPLQIPLALLGLAATLARVLLT